MRDNHLRKSASARATVESTPRGTGVADPGSQRLAKLARAVGNDEVRQRIGTGSATRDNLLNHVGERMGVIRELQRREVALCSREGNHFPWWRQVADRHKTDVTAPKPMQWRESTRLYEDAAYHLCRGDVHRGADLMKQAMDAEDRTRTALTTLVETGDLGSAGSPNRGLTDGVAAGDTAPVCEVPAHISQLAHDIQSVTVELRKFPNRRRVRDPWWTDFEEEEEEEEGAAGS
ncbi:MAG: hypothetical protein ACI8PZ_007579 [Myxococcota bacterium]|jgi:hypothetical protein